MTVTLEIIRQTATSDLPISVANNNCVQDAYFRLREALMLEALVRVDSLGVYDESEEAPAHLIELHQNLFDCLIELRQNLSDWIDEVIGA